jgi:hypothetical protein
LSNSSRNLCSFRLANAAKMIVISIAIQITGCSFFEGDEIARVASDGHKRLNDFYLYKLTGGAVYGGSGGLIDGKSRCSQYPSLASAIAAYAKRTDLIEGIQESLKERPDLQEIKQYTQKYGVWPLACPPVYFTARQENGEQPATFKQWRTSRIEILTTSDTCARDVEAIRQFIAKPDLDSMIEDMLTQNRKIHWKLDPRHGPSETDFSIKARTNPKLLKEYSQYSLDLINRSKVTYDCIILK